MAVTWISLPELRDIVGKDAACALSVHCGGVSVHVPKKESPSHALAKVLGVPGMKKLCAAYGGTWIMAPNGRRPEPFKEQIAALLATGGKTKKAIALQLGVTERYVYMVAGYGPGPAAEQLTLPL